MHSAQAPEALSHWDDFRLFGETAKAGSFSAAARGLQTTQRTISRRIQSLEQRLGVRLFDRLPHGVVLTSEGKKVFDAVRRVDDTFVDIQRRVAGSDGRCKGPVRVSSTDGLTAFWLTPRLRRLQESYPSISVEFQCSVAPANLLNMESDLSIQFRKPETPDLIAVNLGNLHFLPWASPAYLERCGTPVTREELRNHCLLDHKSYHHNGCDCGQWLDLLCTANQVGYWTNSSASLLSATESGIGIGFFPTYFCEFTKSIVPLDIGLRAKSPIWLVYHPDLKRVARVRAVISWIKGLFARDAYPWFRDEFHPPKSPTSTPNPLSRPRELAVGFGAEG